MKKNDLKELRGKNIDQLNSVLSENISALKKAVIDKNTGKSKDKNIIGKKRRMIAYIKTLIKERQLG